ncbi:MAG: hypothetical protein GY710_11930 [Desulfobacteraceae bacterium]|nr:hypothetical protein [Desulfobacteraceae bacterium]
MIQENKVLKDSEITALKTRWQKKSKEGKLTFQQRMLRRLKIHCSKTSEKRPHKLDLRGITLYNEDLSELDLSGYDFSYANLNGSIFAKTNFSFSKFHHASLEKADLDECEFMGADLTYASLNECSAKQGGFGGANLSYASLINSNLSESTLSQSTLIHTDLRATNLEKARLSESNLSHAVFTRANLVQCDLKESDLRKTNFEFADMRGARLMSVKNFKTANWIRVDIRDIDLRGVYLAKRFISDENYLYEFKIGSKLNMFLYHVWKATSDCGRSLSRFSICILGITLVFAALYTQVDINYGDNKTWFSPIYFSIVTLTTLGYGDVLPTSLTGQIIVTLHALTGFTGLGAMLSILGNKLARRAD